MAFSDRLSRDVTVPNLNWLKSDFVDRHVSFSWHLL